MNKQFLKQLMVLTLALVPISLCAQEVKQNPSLIESELTEPLALLLVIIALLLLGVIGALAKGIYIGVDIFKKKHSNNKTAIIALLITLGALIPGLSFAQEVAPQADVMPEMIGGISSSTFFFLSGIIILEVLIIFILLGIFYTLIGDKKAKEADENKPHWIERFNASPSAQGVTDEELAMGHDFDGIEELDNPPPPWWKWGFVLSVVIGIIYLWRYDIAKTAPNQYQELAISTEKADKAVQEYLAKSAANVDENTVVYLDDATNIAAGQQIFVTVCAACHNADGGGNEVGPNLTDDYWLHGGSIKDIFVTIKYGVPEKGMRSWKDDYSPQQIAQLSSFVKSLKGTTPATARAPQGELYVEEGAKPEATPEGAAQPAADSTTQS